MSIDTTYNVRIDSSSANNPALNLTGASSFEITFVKTEPSGDLTLEQGVGNIDPDTLVLIGSTTYQFTYDWSGTLPTLVSQGAGRVPVQFRGDPVIRITILDYPTAGTNTSIMFLPGQNATLAEMDAFRQGAITIGNHDTTPDPVPVCLAAGTPVLTPSGEVAVERLQRGDLVLTRDTGAQPVVWTGSSHHIWPGSAPKQQPVVIRAGALGTGCPAVDFVVSPQHRVLVRDAATGAEVLVPAIGLAGRPGIRQMRGAKAVTYHHVLLPQHAVLTTAGAPSESFWPGPMALRMLGWRQMAEVLRLFPGLGKAPGTGYGPLARPALTRSQAAGVVLGTVGMPGRDAKAS